MTSILTKKHFEEAGYSVEEVADSIFVVDNFLDDSEIAKLKAQLDSMSEDEWRVQYVESMYRFIKEEYGLDTFEEVAALGIRLDIENNWVDKNALIKDQSIIGSLNNKLFKIFSTTPDLEFNGVGSIQRQYEGVELNEHVDSESNPRVAYACVMYVNDDFTGGELNFPRIGYKYKPRAASLIVFPSSYNYLHGVLPVGPGPTRYALPAFINKREDV